MKKQGTIESTRERVRFQQTYNIIMMYFLDYLLGRGFIRSTRDFFLEKLYGVPRMVEEVSAPARVRMMLQDLGPIYVKMGQLISSQSQALPPEWSEELDKLQSDVPPFPYSEVRRTIMDELGAPPEEVYATFNEQPLAAASTAQVHRATLEDGTEVVVKVQRPNIQKQIEADVGIMNWLSSLVERRQQWAADMDLTGVVNEFGSQVLQEIDYRVETYNAFRLTDNLADIQGVRVPIIYSGLSTDRVITMEFIDGFKIINLEAIEAAGYSREMLADVALRATVKMILIDGFFHGDLHPGNVLVSRVNGDIILLDTGMVGELDVRQRFNLISMLYALYNKDVSGLAHAVRSLGIPFREVDDKAFNKDFERRIGRLMQMGNVGFPVILSEVMDVMRENGMQFDPSLTLAMKSIMQMQAISSVLFTGSGLMEKGIDTVRELVMEQVTAENVEEVLKKEVTNTVRDISSQLPTLQEATASWLNQYKKGRFEVYVDTSGLKEPLDRADSLMRQLIIGILLTGIIVGSAIATGIAAAYDIQGSELFSIMAFVGYIAATGLAALVVIAMLWQLWRGRRGQT